MQITSEERARLDAAVHRLGMALVDVGNEIVHLMEQHEHAAEDHNDTMMVGNIAFLAGVVETLNTSYRNLLRLVDMFLGPVIPPEEVETSREEQ